MAEALKGPLQTFYLGNDEPLPDEFSNFVGFCRTKISPLDNFIMGINSRTKDLVCLIDKPFGTDLYIHTEDADYNYCPVTDDYPYYKGFINWENISIGNYPYNCISNVNDCGIMPDWYNTADVISMSAVCLVCCLFFFKFVFGAFAKWKRN